MSDAKHAVLKIWGGQPLQGSVRVSGAKNSALVVMAGALLCPEDCRLRNIPQLADVKRMCEILSAVGVEIQQEGDVLEFNAAEIAPDQAPYELVSQLRASFFIIGPLLARLGAAKIPLPGGCAIGSRPIELHVRGLEAMGAEVVIDHGIANAMVKNPSRRLQGAKIYFDYPSVGATETIMMAATLAEGETILENAAREPEVVDLANFCIAMGANIQGAGTDTIVINGVPKLHTADYSIIADRIEAGTFLVAGAITRSEILVTSVIPDHLSSVISKLEKIGVKIVPESPTSLRVVPTPVWQGRDIKTLPYPGFPTDMQAQLMALLTLAEGNSIITETVFENRLQHVGELNRLGADIRVNGNTAVIKGVPSLTGAPVTATDLRASAALVVAGLAAEGLTTVQCLHHLDRGYENLEAKMRGLGARLERVFDDSPTDATTPDSAI